MILTDLIVEFEEKGEDRRKEVVEKFKKGEPLGNTREWRQMQQMQQMSMQQNQQTGNWGNQLGQGISGTMSLGLFFGGLRNLWGREK